VSENSILDRWLKVLSVLGVIVSFFWGVLVWQTEQVAERTQMVAEANRVAETRKIEATRPFLERQLRLYTEATQVVARLAASSNARDLEDDWKRFQQLYWGELVLVEDSRVEAAMKRFGDALSESKSQQELRQLSLGLAGACRDSLSQSWGVAEWASSN
jgi:hypothetical protein